MINLRDIPTRPQRQDSVSDQLADLRQIANRMGMYDAADAIGQWCKSITEIMYSERKRCATIAERVCREHADPNAGYAASQAILKQ